jgi:EAL domain-containing protein (putative c-di-GMP-specific phosphodiesterase class I)
MAIFGAPQPIEHGEQIVRARRTAALTRVAMGLAGIATILAEPRLGSAWTLAGFATIALSAGVQLAASRTGTLAVEETVSAGAAVLVVGLGPQRVNVIAVLWLVAIASGVLARGGRAHWIGRFVVMGALLLPVIRYGSLDASYAEFVVAVTALLMTAGRLTTELNVLLREARLQADSAETLLLAGDIAARVSERDAPVAGAAPAKLSAAELARARSGLARLVQGDGLEIVVQPIVDIRSGAPHAYEALARFGAAAGGDGRIAGTSPLHWLALAELIGGRPALERACLGAALELLARRPEGTRLSVNVSAPVLMEAATLALLRDAGEDLPDGLSGLIVELTEETLVGADAQLTEAIEPLLARGAALAVDDMGAGYSGLRQITAVRPRYLKLDRSLGAGIDADAERAALVAALAGYSRQVGALLVVEGIETDAELDALQRIGVPLVQGFRLARPGTPWPAIAGSDSIGPGANRSDGPRAGRRSGEVPAREPSRSPGRRRRAPAGAGAAGAR